MPTKRSRAWLYPLLLIILGAVFLVRARYGFDWSDESYYTTLAYRLAQGERLFVDMWELHQLSVIPLYPLARLFLLIQNGSTEGMILFFRTSFVLFETGVALILYVLYKKRHGELTAFLVAALSQCFVHFGLANFSYDSMTVLFMFLSVALLPEEADGRVLRSGGSGFFYCLAVQCYPQLIISLPVILIYWVIRLRQDGWKRQFCGFLAGGVALCLLFISFILDASDISAVLPSLPYILDDPTHGGDSYLYLFLNYCHTLIVIFGPAFYAAVLLFLASLWLTLIKRRTDERSRTWLLYATYACGFLCILRILTYPIDASSKLNFLAMSLVPIFPTLLVLTRGKLNHAVLLFMLGLSFSLSAQLFSNMRIYASSFPLILSTAAVLLYLSECKMTKVRLLYPALGILCLAAIFAFRLAASHREAPVQTLSAKLEVGPAQGLVSTDETKEAYTAIYAAVTSAVSAEPEAKTLLVSSMLPFGYLMTELLPAAQSVWHSPCTPRLESYYERNPSHLPDLILTVTEGIGFSTGDGNVEALFTALADAGRDVSLVEENAYCRIYRVN